jgi:uncharacterized RDD family membrane protein YckC
MNEIERYVAEVMRNVNLSRRERERIEADLRSHLAEATAAGAPPAEAILRLGSPAQVAEAFMLGAKLSYAGVWRRLAAFAVDAALALAVAAPLVGIGVGLSNMLPAALEWGWWANAALFGVAMSFGIAGTAAALLYFPIAEGRFGQTLGKRWLGLRVLKESGLPIGYKEAFLRRIPLYFRFAVLDALFVPFTAKKQRAFDLVARTVVVKG